MQRKMKFIILLLFLFGFSLLLFDNFFQLKTFNSSKLQKSTWSAFVDQNSSTKEPLILLLKYSDKWWGFNWADKNQRSALHLGECPHKCRFTYDRKRYMDTADMVILNAFLYRNPPNSVPSRQRCKSF